MHLLALWAGSVSYFVAGVPLLRYGSEWAGLLGFGLVGFLIYIACVGGYLLVWHICTASSSFVCPFFAHGI